MKAVLLDIEGTVTDKRFVSETLFPFARARLEAFLKAEAGTPPVAAAIAAMRNEMGAGASLDRIADELTSWIDRDLKKEPLKSLQGLIWREGYASGALRSHLYGDVPAALAAWRAHGVRLAVFSSGSIEAQRQLFAHTVHGDFTGAFEAHFDLSTGAKTESASYLKIARALDLAPGDVRFYSDLPAEVAAAEAAGLEAVLVERDGPIATDVRSRRIQSFVGEAT